MKRTKRSYIFVVALILAGLVGSRTVQAGVVAASNITVGATSYATGDGLVTLTPYSVVSNLAVGAFGSTNNYFGVQGVGNDNAVNDADGNPFTEDDREAIDIDLDATVGLTEIGFVFSRADGPASNGVPSGIVISGFVEDPGVWTDTGVISTYANGAIYLNYSYDNGDVRSFGFTNLLASTGQTLRLSVNDFNQANAQAAVVSITYGDDPFSPPPPPPPPSGYVSWSNVVAGTSSYVSGDGLLTMVPFAEGLTSTGTFGVAEANQAFGVTGGARDFTVNDADGDPVTEFDREAIDITLDAAAGLTEIAFTQSRADGADFINGTPSGIVISGFTEDPGIWTESSIASSYDSGAVYINTPWLGTNIRTFYFTNLTASAGQTLRLSVNDSNQGTPWAGINYIGFGDEPILPPEPPAGPFGTIAPSNIVEGTSSYVTDDGLVTLTPYQAEFNLVVGTFAFRSNTTVGDWFGVTGAGNGVIRDDDGSAFTTDDRRALGIELDRGAALSQLSFIYSRADGPSSNGVPSGIVISGFLEDPQVTHFNGSYATSYTNGAVYINYPYDGGIVQTFIFSNLTASAGQTLLLAANDFDQAGPQAAMKLIGYEEFVPVQQAVLSIANESGQLSVTAGNMGIVASNTLQGATSLVFANWVDLATTTGVEQVTWPITAPDSVEFFRVKSE